MSVPSFSKVLQEHTIPLFAKSIDIFQINVGKVCNLACKHCHVEAGPKRTESMTKEILEKCLELIDVHDFQTIDLTGGTPEMNPHLPWFIKELGKRNKEVLVRSNLVVLLEEEFQPLVDLFYEYKITLIASFPHFQQERTNRQRGTGIFEKLVKIIKILNQMGYGKTENLKLHLVHNPVGAYLPGNQKTLEIEYKKHLSENYGLSFNSLFCITNMPIGRFLDYLYKTDNYESYMEELVNAFNPKTLENVMCTNTISVGYDGKLFDCDFNQMFGLEMEEGLPHHIRDFDYPSLSKRKIKIGNHCFGCTAGSGSSCQGEVTS